MAPHRPLTQVLKISEGAARKSHLRREVLASSRHGDILRLSGTMPPDPDATLRPHHRISLNRSRERSKAGAG